MPAGMIATRRQFLGAAAATIFVPKFGRWFSRPSGVLARDDVPIVRLREFYVIRGVDLRGSTLEIKLVDFTPESICAGIDRTLLADVASQPLPGTPDTR